MTGFLEGYYDTLTSDSSKKRYREKLHLMNGLDPYEVKKEDWKDDVDLWLGITNVHACMYLILTPSPYSDKDMLNYKSLDSYQNFVKGWVRQVLVKVLKNNRIVIGKVNHSQKLSEKPLTPWVLSTIEGKILAAHCDCMAGLGETCSHVSSLLWVIAVGVEKRESLTCTQKSAYWVIPPAIRSAPYAPIKDINFVGKKRKLASCTGNATSSVGIKQKKFDVPSAEEQKQFFDSLAACSRNTKPAVLSVISNCSDEYIPSALSSDLPPLLTDLYKPCNLSLSYCELIKVSSETVVTVTDEQSKAVEMKTRDQSNSRLWFRMRAGRITASKFKSVCHTDSATPSLSLIMSICHPSLVQFKTAATLWGCQHEKQALEEYKKLSVSNHDRFHISPAGFFISAEHPYLGASPDGMVYCSCCKPGICEVKCPFCHKHDKIEEAAEEDSNFCLHKNCDGELKLKTHHQYYYQVQAQLFCTGLSYCDFIVCTEKEIHVERVKPDTAFMKKNLLIAKNFFDVAVLPELLGRWFSRPSDRTCTCISSITDDHDDPVQAPVIYNDTEPDSQPASSSAEPDAPGTQKYCYCQQTESGKMVGCDNESCNYQWFHLDCLKLNCFPKASKWYCPDCRKLKK